MVWWYRGTILLKDNLWYHKKSKDNNHYNDYSYPNITLKTNFKKKWGTHLNNVHLDLTNYILI